MKARTTRQTPATPAPIHATLTIDDRDAFDRLRGRIERQACLTLHSLLQWDEGLEEMEDRHQAVLQKALIELAAEILADAEALRALLDEAATRTDGAR